MARILRQNWDSVKDCARPQSDFEEYQLWNAANAKPIPEYRAKLVEIVHGQYELSVTTVNPINVINARMGFNPLLDCGRRIDFADDEREQRDEENKKRAAKRAKQTTRHLVKASLADHMLTFSYRKNETDKKTVVKHWHEFVRLFRVRFPDWSYVAVVEKQDRGAFHIHVAVKGRQEIKWLRRCWLKAIGQPNEEVGDWYNHGVKLGEKSLGAVDVRAPGARWGGKGKWRRDKLSAYLTKYIGKDYEESEKGAKKYWASRNIEKPVIKRFWLKAKTYLEAIREAHGHINDRRVDNMNIWACQRSGVVWITGEVAPENLSWEHCKQGDPYIDFLTYEESVLQ